MSWLGAAEDADECDLRATGEYFVDPWFASSRDIDHVFDEVVICSSQAKIKRVLEDVPALARVILDVIDRARELGHSRDPRLSWFDETPNQLLLEFPSGPDVASDFLNALDAWIVEHEPSYAHRRLIIDVCFAA